jgi:mono/diheme cytochrome c family protein
MMSADRRLRASPAAVALGLSLIASVPLSAQTPWLAPEAEKARKPPASATGPQAIEAGKKSAQLNCASCHGATGKGNGPAAIALNPKPADWTARMVQDESDGEIFWKITNGRGAMPPWRHLPETERWALVAFIRSLGGK